MDIPLDVSPATKGNSMTEAELREYTAKKVIITEACLRCSECVVHPPFDTWDRKWWALLPYAKKHLNSHSKLYIFVWKRSGCCSEEDFLPDSMREQKWVEFCTSDEYAGTDKDPLMADVMFEAKKFGLDIKPEDLEDMEDMHDKFFDCMDVSDEDNVPEEYSYHFYPGLSVVITKHSKNRPERQQRREVADERRRPEERK